MDKEKYKSIKKEFENELPHPYFYFEDDAEEFFEKIKMDYPNATMHKIKNLGTAICVDKHSRMILGFELLGISKERSCAAFAYCNEAYQYEIEAQFVLDSAKED